jgi:hypothetical protein
MLQLKWLMQEFNSEIEFTSHELEGPLFIFPPISLYFLFPLNTEPIVRIWALTVYFLADHRKQDCQTGKQKHWYRGKANTLCVLEVLAIEIGAQLYWKLRCTQNASWILWRIRDCALYLLTLLHCKVGLWVWTYPPLWATSALGPGSRLPKKLRSRKGIVLTVAQEVDPAHKHGTSHLLRPEVGTRASTKPVWQSQVSHLESIFATHGLFVLKVTQAGLGI